MFIYPHDPERVQEQLREAIRAAQDWRETARGRWATMVGIRRALRACPCAEMRADLERQGQELQERHRLAASSAELCEEAVTALQKRLAEIADAALSGCPCLDEEYAA